MTVDHIDIETRVRTVTEMEYLLRLTEAYDIERDGHPALKLLFRDDRKPTFVTTLMKIDTDDDRVETISIGDTEYDIEAARLSTHIEDWPKMLRRLTIHMCISRRSRRQ